MEKTRDEQFDNYQREALAATADSKSALIAGFLAGAALFCSIIGLYLILLLLMAIMGTFLSLPTLKEAATRSSAAIGISGDVRSLFQSLLSMAMLLSLLGAFSGKINRKNKLISVWNIKFNKDFIPYYLLSVLLIGSYFVSLLPQATITIITLSDNTGSVPLWGIIILVLGIAIPPSILLYETWWYWYKKIIPSWVRDKNKLTSS